MRIANQKRTITAIILLILMVANFAIEGAQLYRVYAAPLLVSAKPSTCSGTSCSISACKAEGATSCCSQEKKASACGCPCCGDSCPMGDACTCLANGKSSTKSEGLFFRLPGCHPAQPDSHGAYLPFSMRLVYLPVELPDPAYSTDIIEIVANSDTPLAGTLPAPPVPPPECSAA